MPKFSVTVAAESMHRITVNAADEEAAKSAALDKVKKKTGAWNAEVKRVVKDPLDLVKIFLEK